MPRRGSCDPLDDQIQLIADRIEFLEMLEEMGPLDTRDVVDELDHSRSTVTRALGALREADLVEKTDAGYAPTVAGAMAADQYRRYERTSKAILSSKELLAPLPDAETLPVELLVNAETVQARSAVPVRPLEALSDRVRKADRVRAYLPTLVNTHLLRVWHRVVCTRAVTTSLVVDPHLLTVLKGQYPRLLAEMADTDAFAAHAVEGPPYGVFLITTDGTTRVSMVVYEDETAVQGILTNNREPAVAWARDQLDRLQGDAAMVTEDLADLGPAVGDGGVGAASLPDGTTVAPTKPDEGASHDLPVDLEREGFVRLSERYFGTHEVAPPAVSWRTGFTLAEVQAGHAVDRQDDDGQNITDRLVEDLRQGDDHVILGPPGSGKSTVCMAVACRWYDRNYGPVLYRERGAGNSLESAALMEAYLRETDGHALIVVEDAVRQQANVVFDVMRALDSANDVTFLLDSRTQAWRDADETAVDARRDAYRLTEVNPIVVPTFDERECQRFVDHLENLLEEEIDLTGAELATLVKPGDGHADADGLPPGSAVVAQHHLSCRQDPVIDDETQPPTALEESVRRTLRSLRDREPAVALDVAVLASLLNVAGVPVATEYLSAVAPDGSLAEVDAALDLLEGWVLFDADRGGVDAGPPETYRNHHETWSVRFLQAFYEETPSGRARERFGRGVTRLLSLADDTRRRRRIERHLDGRTPHIHRIEADTSNWAAEVLERVYGAGRTAPGLAPLFGETVDGIVELPEAVPDWLTVQTAYWSGQMNSARGDFDRAEREFRRARDQAASVDVPNEVVRSPAPSNPTRRREHTSDRAMETESEVRTCWRAVAAAALGAVARECGRFDAATEHFEESLARFMELDYPRGEARALKQLGNVAYKRGDLDTAERYYTDSAALFRQAGDDHGEATVQHNRGLIAHGRGDLSAAANHFKQSIDRYRDIGDRYSEATALRNRGAVARDRGELETAAASIEESLAICRDIGDRHGEAAALRNLGVLALRRDEPLVATDRLENALGLFRQIGDGQDVAHVLENLGTAARERGAYETAVEHLEESLAICRDIGDQHGEATSLLELGRVARERGESSTAHSRFEASAEVCLAAGFEEAEAALAGVVDTCERTGCVDDAAEWCERAIEYALKYDRPALRERFEERLALLTDETT